MNGRARAGRPVAKLELAIWAGLFAPLSVFLHELGHWLAGRALGYSTVLGVANVTAGAERGVAPGWQVALDSGAGPAVTIALTLIGVTVSRRWPVRAWALALAATAPIRFLIAATALAVDLLIAVRGGSRGTPQFDEYNLAAANGLPVQPILAAEVAFLFWVWWLIWRKLPRRRLGSAALLAAGAIVGLVLWLRVVGPVVIASFR